MASGSMIFDMVAQSQTDRTVARARAASERMNADLQARLDSAVVRMTATTGSLDEMAQMVERRHAALTQVMGMFRGVEEAEQALRPAPALNPDRSSPVQRMIAVRMDQERLIARAETEAQTRAERLRLAFRLAGLNPAAYTPHDAALGGPLVEARDWAPLSDTDPINNRPTLAQTFAMANGERFSLLVNHLKSKGSCPAPGDADYAGNNDSGDGQGCWNLQRKLQAQRLRSFVAQVQTAAGNNDVLLVGDFNAYAQEDPIFDLTSNGYIDQVGRFSNFGYSYVFDGAAGRLDQAITTATLSSRVTRAVDWHINADESPLQDYNLEFKAPLATCGGPCPADPYTAAPWRASDHDPVVVGLALYKSITAAPTSTAVVGTAGDDIIYSGAGRRTLTGGGGNDQFVFTAGFAGGATLTDLGVGDTINLKAVLLNLGISSSNPIGQGYLKCTASVGGVLISIDPDAAGSALPRAMILIKNRDCSVLSPTTFVQ